MLTGVRAAVLATAGVRVGRKRLLFRLCSSAASMYVCPTGVCREVGRGESPLIVPGRVVVEAAKWSSPGSRWTEARTSAVGAVMLSRGDGGSRAAVIFRRAIEEARRSLAK